MSASTREPMPDVIASVSDDTKFDWRLTRVCVEPSVAAEIGVARDRVGELRKAGGADHRGAGFGVIPMAFCDVVQPGGGARQSRVDRLARRAEPSGNILGQRGDRTAMAAHGFGRCGLL